MTQRVLALLILLFTPVMAMAQYSIQPGDTLTISVLEDPNLSRTVLVRPDGGISMPIAGNIRAGGNSVTTVERLITERLASGFSVTPTVSVALTALGNPPQPNPPGTIDVFFMGEINSSGMRQIDSGLTLLQAIAEAGGLTQFAADKRVQLRRTDRKGHETVYLFDYSAVERGVGIKNNLVVRSGDVILVPERKLFE